MKYIVRVALKPQRWEDDIFDGDYSGEEYESQEEAEKELEEAWKNPNIWDAWIDER